MRGPKFRPLLRLMSTDDAGPVSDYWSKIHATEFRGTKKQKRLLFAKDCGNSDRQYLSVQPIHVQRPAQLSAARTEVPAD